MPTVRHWLTHWQQHGDVTDAPRSGRPPVTTEYQRAAIVHSSECDPFASAPAIRLQLGLDVSDDTIRRVLDEAGLPARSAANKRRYTADERLARLSFARGYLDKGEAWWSRVLFSDESNFYGIGHGRHVIVRRPAGHRLDPKYTWHRVAHPPQCGVWACFSAAGPGFAKAFHGALTGVDLLRILAENLIASASELCIGDGGWWLLHDNAPTFTGDVVQTWLFNHGIQLLAFPPYSPDLNPIENLWAQVHKPVAQRHPRTPEQVADAFCAEWPHVTADRCRALALSMHERCEAVIASDGNATRF